jgi:hypothetical protein
VLVPWISKPGHEAQTPGPLRFIAEGEFDAARTILHRIFQTKKFIAKFVRATASHFKRFDNAEVAVAGYNFHMLWLWARHFRQDALCAVFLTTIRTSAPFWRNLFEASSRAPSHCNNGFQRTPYWTTPEFASSLIDCRDSASEAQALAKLWVSTGIFDALEVTIGEALHHGQENEQLKLCRTPSCFWVKL